MKKTGRPRKTSQRSYHVIRQTVMRSPNTSCRKIRANFLNNGTDISMTVSRRLSKEFGLKSYKLSAKSRVTSDMRKEEIIIFCK